MRRLSAVLVALTIGGPWGGASAQQPAVLADEIVVGALRHWPPEYGVDEHGEPTGFAIDIMSAVAERAGLRVRYELFDAFSELEQALADGRIDVIPNYGITEPRLEHAAFTPTVETFVLALFVRVDMPDVEALEDLLGHPIAVVQTNAAVDLLAQRGFSTVMYDDVETALFDLLAGHVDALAFPAQVLRARAQDVGVEERIRQIGAPLAEIRRAIAVRQDAQDLLARLSAAVNDVVEGPSYRAIYTRWYGEEPPFWTVERVLWVAGTVVVGLVVAVAIWRYRVLARHNRELRARIAERDAAQAALADSERKYRQIVETTADGVWVIDTAGATTFVNERMAEILGVAAAAMLGRPMYDFFDDEMIAVAKQNLQRRRAGIMEVHDFRLQRADGTEVQVLMSTNPIVEQGEFRGALAMVTDVTERRRLEDRLHEGQKLEALGRLAGGVAHDFNNLLVVIRTSAELVRQAVRPEADVRSDLDHIDDACERAQALAAQLLAFSRQQRTQPQVLRPAERLVASERLVRRLLGDEITLRLPAPSDGGAVKIDPAQFDQLVLNLTINARDAMPEGGQLDVSVDDVSAENGASGERVRIEVADNGVGMSPEVLERVFEPFFTTKGSGGGTGLGLATCYGIVTQAGGLIEVESRVGEGTRFRIELPKVVAEAEEQAPTAES